MTAPASSVRLLDHHPAVQRDLQLPGHHRPLRDRPLLQDPDRGHVDQRAGR